MSGEEQPDVFLFAMGDETINDEEAGTDNTGWGESWKTMEWYGWFLNLAVARCC